MDVPTRADRHDLSVDAQETVRQALDSVREADAPALSAVLRTTSGADADTSTYVADALTKIGHEDVAPRNLDGPDEIGDNVVLRELEKLDYLTLHDLAYESSGASYLDEGRSL
nr:hypothetical protein [Micromonospora sp. DSM 115978]